MRVVRVLVGMLILLLAVPVLAAGALAWSVMQHRSADGTFHAQLSAIDAPGRIVVVPDVDALLHRDAPIARAEQTELRLTVANGGFVGMAAPADLAAYLAGVSYTELARARLGQGDLAVQTRQVFASGDVLAPHENQFFWVRGGAGELRWSPAADRDRHIALIVIAPPGEGPIRLNVALTAGWLNSTTWGLLILGPVLLLLGLAALAWPQRPREIVYVVDGAVATQAGLPPAPPIWRPAPAYVPQPTPAVEADLAWPSSESDEDTEEFPRLPPDLPMPTAGMHLHLTKPRR